MSLYSSPPEPTQTPAPLPLELVRGGAEGRHAEARAGEREAEIARALERATGSELSPEAIEALASEAPLVPPREPLGARLANFFGRRQLLLFVLSFFALWAIVVMPPFGADADLAPGAVAPRDVVAPHSAFLPDRAETQKRRDAAAALVTPAYDPNPAALSQALIELPELARRTRRALESSRAPVSPAPAVSSDAATSANAPSRASPARRDQNAPARSAGNSASARGAAVNGSTANSAVANGSTTNGAAPSEGANAPLANGPQALARFQNIAKWKPAPATMSALLAVEPARWSLVEDAATGAVRAAYLRGRIRSDVAPDSEGVRPLLRAQVETFSAREPLSAPEKITALALAARAATTPNVVVNQEKTDAARRDARAQVLPVFTHIEANAPIVRAGERIAGEQWTQLQELGIARPRFNPLSALALGALCLMLVSGAAAYIGGARRDVLARPAALWLMSVVPIVFLLAFRLILRVPHADFLMIALASTAAMLLTVLLDMRLGVPAGFVVAALCALMAGADAGLFLVATLSAWIGALVVARLSSRFALLRAILVLALVNGLLALALGVLHEDLWDEVISSTAWNALAGGASVVAMAGLAIFLERPFGITSHLRLLELLSPDETVIRRMQTEAPGTYTHSLMVASLAEAGAKQVGADSLLCRVAGLYHDIGKLRRPHCFIENQRGDNIHDRLSPGLSALLIKAHVKDGLELGRAIRLPLPVLEMIASHHGKSSIAYFLHRAREQAGEGGVDENIYRYPGPRPRSREAAILLLADTLEASTRSIPHLTPDKLEAHIEKIVEARVREGDLSESELSLREIAAIRAAFVTTMRGAMHGRIAYPDAGRVESDGDWVAQTLGEKPERRGAPGAGVARSNAAKSGDANGAKNHGAGADKAANSGDTDSSGGSARGAQSRQNEKGECILPSKRARRRALKNADTVHSNDSANERRPAKSNVGSP